MTAVRTTYAAGLVRRCLARLHGSTRVMGAQPGVCLVGYANVTALHAGSPRAAAGNGAEWRPVFPRPPSAGQNKRGFTLLELLVVIVIIGLLAAYVGPRYFAQLSKSERGSAKAQIEGLGKALDAYRLDTGRYPTTEQGLGALFERPNDEPKWAGPYLQKAVPADPWGRPYVYRSPGQSAEFDLISLGKDGQVGGSGEGADVSYQ